MVRAEARWAKPKSAGEKPVCLAPPIFRDGTRASDDCVDKFHSIFHLGKNQDSTTFSRKEALPHFGKNSEASPGASEKLPLGKRIYDSVNWHRFILFYSSFAKNRRFQLILWSFSSINI
jgi:hypothetical protein